MKKFFKVILWALFLSAATQTFAQAETFDMMTFIPPKGWERQEGDGFIAFSKPDKSCVFVIYRSRESSGSGETDFKNEWQQRVGKGLNTAVEPKTQEPLKAESGDGEMRMGGANVEYKGTKVSALLTVFRGYGRVMSVLSLYGRGCEDDLKEFLPRLELSQPRPPR